ncbi:thioredoxin-like protein [Ilyonectria robusta]|uniref:thioredoxin-like protein n=1 Tax=Ilyonectria robusta TaxID=1079257 RepID=UPI001E8E3D88|nr:thioredoxin-like protein [Ilyonectria robusta]KAH8733435.1 thioredoxin-like protein [Ilyonectria robusta]
MVLIKSFVLAALAASATAKSAVIELLPTNFDKVVLNSGKPTLVEFFAPWCGHCKTLAPVYEDLAFSLEYAKDKVQIAKVDADAHRELGKRFGVQGFPTLKWFDGKSNKPQDYKSGRDLDSLTDFIAEKTGVKPKKKQEMPSDIVMLNEGSFNEVVGGDKHVLIAFTAPWCGHCKTLAPTWESLATDFANDENVVIAKVDADATQNKAWAKSQGVSGYPTIKFYPAGTKEAVDYKGGRSENDLVKYINLQAGTHRVTGGELDSVVGTLEVLDTLVTKFINGGDLAKVTAEVEKAAKTLKDAAEIKYAEYYVRIFDKIRKTEGYVAKELARLEGILEKGGLAGSKRDQIQTRTNVLRKFVKEDEDVKDEL